MADDTTAVPMTREELQETVASTICCHTQMSPAVQWEVDLLMGAIDKHVELRLSEYFGNLVATYDQAKMDLVKREVENARLKGALGRLRQMADAWEARLPEAIRTATVADAVRTTVDGAL